MTNKRLAKGRATAAVAGMYGEGASVFIAFAKVRTVGNNCNTILTSPD